MSVLYGIPGISLKTFCGSLVPLQGQAADLRSGDGGRGFGVFFVGLGLQAGLHLDGQVAKRGHGQVIRNGEQLGKPLPLNRTHIDPDSTRGDEFFHGVPCCPD